MGKVHKGIEMKTFKEFMDGEFEQDIDKGQDDDLQALKKLVDDFNEYAPQKDNMMSVVQVEKDASFTLFVGPDEITTGSVPEITVMVKQIRQEHGF